MRLESTKSAFSSCDKLCRGNPALQKGTRMSVAAMSVEPATTPRAELAALHRALAFALAALTEETSKAEPDIEALARVRLRLSKASRRRRMVVDALLAETLRSSAGSDQMYGELRDAIRTARARSTDHIARWSLQAMAEDWAGYRLASLELRRSMRMLIDREAHLLQNNSRTRAAAAAPDRQVANI